MISGRRARGFCRALSRFDAKFEQDEQGVCIVVITLHGNEEIVGVLNAIERHVSARDDGPAMIGLDGDSYVMEPS